MKWPAIYAIFRVAFGDHPEVRLRTREGLDVEVRFDQEPWGLFGTVTLSGFAIEVSGAPYVEMVAREVVRAYEEVKRDGPPMVRSRAVVL